MGNVTGPGAGSGPIPFELPDRYTLLGSLIGGAQGQVVKLHDAKMRRFVALKILQAPHDNLVRRRFRSEVASLLELSGHPNVVSLYDYEESEQYLLLFLEYCEFGSLAGRVDPDNPMPLAELSRIGAQVAAGLAAAHARRIVHRDIKPANLLRSREAVKIADFGIATLAELDTPSRTRTGGAGTDRYTAPEVLAGESATPASDIYSLAVTLTEMAGISKADLHAPDEPDRTKTLAPLLGTAARPVRHLLARMMASQPADRPTAAEVATALQYASQRLGTPAESAGTLPPPTSAPPQTLAPGAPVQLKTGQRRQTLRHPQRSRLAAWALSAHGAVALLVVVALVAAGVVAWRLRSPAPQSATNGGRGQALAQGDTARAPRLAAFVPASQRVSRVYRFSLDGAGVPEIVVVTTSQPTARDPVPAEDLLLLAWDRYTHRWSLVYDAARTRVNVTYSPEFFASSGLLKPSPLFPPKQGVTGIRLAEINDQGAAGGADLLVSASITAGNGAAQVTGIIHYNGLTAEVAWAFSGTGGTASVIGTAPDQKVAVTSAWYTPSDPHCCPVRNYRFVLAPGSDQNGEYYYVVSDNRPWLGVVIKMKPPFPRHSRAIVTSVIPGSPAAGILKPGDILQAVAGPAIANRGFLPAVVDELAGHQSGDVVRLQIRRGSALRFVTVKLGTLADTKAVNAGFAITSSGNVQEYML